MINLSLCCGATLIALAVVQVHQVSGFWFSDGSLSQEPATQINLNQVRSETSSSQSAKYVGQSNNGVALESQKESTIQVDPSSIQQQCQCSADWIQNQTKLWLAKWMAQQQSLAPSNSTGATLDNNINRPNAKQGQQASNNNGSNNNNQVGSHWSGWVSKPAGNRASSLHEQARARTRKLQANQQQTGKRGERGPKGEQGARGQPGPAGLISVRDRDALFDLPDQLVSANQNGSLPARRLVFIENEQLLVMQADSGWRPVPLLAPLRDFRKTIAKPSVASLAHDRRKLLRQEQKSILTLDASLDNSIRDGLVYDLAAQSPKVYENSLEDDDNDDDEDDDDDDEDDEDADDVNMEDSDDDDQLNISALTKSSRKSSKSIIPVTGRSGAGLVDNSIVQQLDLTRARDLQQTKSIAPKDRRLKLRLVALNEPFSGNVHGIRGADFECKRHATRSQIKGSFRAFLASGFQNLNELVRYNVHKYPIVNLRGEQLANSWHDLFKQPARMANPLSRIYSFDGRHVASDSNWPNKLVWHGANNKAGHRDSMHNCDGWHSDSLSKFGMASPLHQPRLGHNKRRQRKRHLSQDLANSTESRPAVLEIIDKYPCRMPLIVLCIETIGQYSDSYVKSGDSLGIENNLILV